MDHFNNRDASVVPELEADLKLNSCSLHFPHIKIVDSQTASEVSVKALWDETRERIPCAVLGPVFSDATRDLLPAVDALNIPLLSYYNENVELVSNPNVVATTLSVQGRASAMISYLRDRDYLAVWHSNTPQETALAEAIIQEAADDIQINAFRNSFGDNVKAKLQQMKDSGIKTIFLSVWEPAQMPGYAKMLDELGMLESEFLYILPPELVPHDAIDVLYGSQYPGSPLDKLLSGALVFDRLDGFGHDEYNDKFLRAWRKQDSEAVFQLNRAVPESAYYYASEDYFQKQFPAAGSSFVYDAIMTLALGGCRAEDTARRQASEQAAAEARGEVFPNPAKVQPAPPVPVLEGFTAKPPPPPQDEAPEPRTDERPPPPLPAEEQEERPPPPVEGDKQERPPPQRDGPPPRNEGPPRTEGPPRNEGPGAGGAGNQGPGAGRGGGSPQPPQFQGPGGGGAGNQGPGGFHQQPPINHGPGNQWPSGGPNPGPNQGSNQGLHRPGSNRGPPPPQQQGPSQTSPNAGRQQSPGQSGSNQDNTQQNPGQTSSNDGTQQATDDSPRQSGKKTDSKYSPRKQWRYTARWHQQWWWESARLQQSSKKWQHQQWWKSARPQQPSKQHQ